MSMNPAERRAAAPSGAWNANPGTSAAAQAERTGARVAYLINQYPKVSHSFIRREILALEARGVAVTRYALRGWDGDAIDADDLQERSRTRYLLQGGGLPLLKATFAAALQGPGRWLAALRQAARMSRRGDRPLPVHLIYFAEACLLVQWLRDEGATHLHAHFGTNPAEVAMLARLLGGPAYSFTVHGPEEFDRPLALKLREKAQHAAFVVAISSYGRSQLYRWVAAGDWHKVQVVHCGLEHGFHDVPPGSFPTAPQLVCVGRLCEQKGQLLLVDAAHRLKQAGIDFHLVLAGDGELRADIEDRIRRHGLARQVHITGWISSEQVREHILASRALVLPSFAEGLPVVLMEAMALRRPVVTTYVAGIPELVIDGDNGWLVPAGDIDALTRALTACLTAPLSNLVAMGERARLRAIERHTVDTEAAKLAALFAHAPEAVFA